MVEPAEPRLGTHSFNCRHQSSIVHCQVLRLADSFFLWLADSPSFQQLAVGMPRGPEAVSSLLLNQGVRGQSDQLASRLARRTGKQVFVSCNVNLEDAALRQALEARVVEELKECPDKF
ncbi:proteasome assembly chaperone 4-like [Amphibalanus amphitrite]|uniref:proteasome assembly chaperone 4-like n=1 Tax=Amphibalanus amphitrite TaxID=1232801 RepID=UPI001C909295|nr:proteasome assembly chaperone 4-like [Amphibalanus amphitrite]